jgi:hypothetical protein
MDNPTVPFSDTTQFRPTDVASTIFDGEADELQPSTYTTTLSPSLLSDLKRFADEPGGTELLPVLAACVRHARPLALHLQHGRNVLRLSVFPRDQLFHCRRTCARCRASSSPACASCMSSPKRCSRRSRPMARAAVR